MLYRFFLLGRKLRTFMSGKKMDRKKLKSLCFVLFVSFPLANAFPSNSQEIIDDYYLQQLQQLDGNGRQPNTESTESTVSSAKTREMRTGIRKESGELISTFEKSKCYEEANLMREARDIMIQKMSSEAFRWGGQQIELLSAACKLRMLGESLK